MIFNILEAALFEFWLGVVPTGCFIYDIKAILAMRFSPTLVGFQRLFNLLLDLFAEVQLLENFRGNLDHLATFFESNDVIDNAPVFRV